MGMLSRYSGVRKSTRTAAQTDGEEAEGSLGHGAGASVRRFRVWGLQVQVQGAPVVGDFTI